MVGRQFRYDVATTQIHFEGIEPIVEESEVETESGNELTESVKADSVYLLAEELTTTDETVEGEMTETTVPTVDPADGTGEEHKIPFDTVRVAWLQGRIEEL